MSINGITSKFMLIIRTIELYVILTLEIQGFLGTQWVEEYPLMKSNILGVEELA